MGSTELATTNPIELVRSMTPAKRAETRELLTANVAELSDDEFALLEELERQADLERVTKLPKAAIVHHGVAKPGVDMGGDGLLRDFEACIVIAEPRRGLWPKEQTNSGPLCSSQDGIEPLLSVVIDSTRGPERTGPQCAGCLFNAWGSAGLMNLEAADSNSKACKEQVLMVLLVKGKNLPVLFFVPPTSLREFEQYKANMVFAGKSLIGHYTRFQVEKAEGDGGYQYGKLSMEAGGPLEIADRRRMFQLRAMYEATVKQTTVAAAAEGVTGVADDGEVIEGEVEE